MNIQDVVRISDLYNQTQSDFYSIDNDIDSMTIKKPAFLPNFKNPCWMENLTASMLESDPDHNASCHHGNFDRPKGEVYHDPLKEIRERLAKCIASNGGVCERVRCLPFYYIAGFSKCGTTDIHSSLKWHPHIAGSIGKEPMYWNRNRYRGSPAPVHKNGTLAKSKCTGSSIYRPFRDYLDIYDTPSQVILNKAKTDSSTGLLYHHMITGDATPSYSYEFRGWRSLEAHKNLEEPKYIIADIIHRFTPQAKVILILRNPTDRLLSEYLYFLQDGEKSAAHFHQLVTREIGQVTSCMKRNTERTCLYTQDYSLRQSLVHVCIGMYEPYIRDWLRVFPRDQVFITRLEDYAPNRTYVINQITDFLGIAPFKSGILDKKKVSNQGPQKRTEMVMLPETKKLLDDFYRPWNERLALLLQDSKYLWMED